MTRCRYGELGAVFGTCAATPMATVVAGGLGAAVGDGRSDWNVRASPTPAIATRTTSRMSGRRPAGSGTGCGSPRILILAVVPVPGPFGAANVIDPPGRSDSQVIKE
jgi:hypothetical protein